MTKETKIQKVKELIEAENQKSKEYLKQLYSVVPTLEVFHEDEEFLYIRSSDYILFSIPYALVNSCNLWSITLVVSAGFRYTDSGTLEKYPMLCLYF